MNDFGCAPEIHVVSQQAEVDPDDLMLRVQAGEPDALSMLMERYWSGLVRYASQMLGSLDEAVDVAQEVFVRVWQHRASWESRGSVQAYLYQIARNLVLLDQRNREVRSRTEPEVRRRQGTVPTPLDHATRGELRQALESALAALPDRRREALVLVRIEGFTLAEAAEVMGVTKRTVANHVHMAVCELEQMLRPFLT